jgi:hypothetical protein
VALRAYHRETGASEFPLEKVAFSRSRERELTLSREIRGRECRESASSVRPRNSNDKIHARGIHGDESR